MNRAASPSSTTAPSNNAPPTELLDAIPAYHMDGGIPVITPTFEEFKDFRRFITTIDPLGAESGLVKVIPPREWLDSLPPITKQMTDLIRLDTAIKQRFTGTGGVFTQMNMSCRKRLSLADWKALCESDKHRPPQLDLSGQSTRVDVRNSKRQRRSESHDESASFSSSTHAPGEAYDEQEPAIAVDEAHQLTSNLIPDRGQFPDSPEYLKELERNYWKNLTFMEPWYGADIAGSLLDQQGVQHWNIAKLDSLLCRLKRPLPGVNTPYLYFGMWKATFAWHLEDMDLYSINYIHFGAPKQWYVIPPEHRERFERVCQSVFATDYRNCSEFMRHKTFQLSPKFLSHHSIPYRKIVHREGEFMITFPYAYHAGFNLGYNCAESTNFAIERWIEIGRQAKSCECVNYSVRIDVDALLGLNASEQKRKRERTAKKEIIKQCLICGREDLSDTMLPVEAREKFIHRHCALWIPELSIERDGEAGEEEVVGLESIPRARWKLECKYCSYQKGACIQCYSNRCFRSFHPSCAIEEQLCMQTRPMEQDGHRSILYECFCPQHDPRKSLVKLTKQQMHAAEIMRAIDDTSAGPIIFWARWSDGYFYSGRLQQDFRDRSMCRIIFIDGYVKLIKYSDIQLSKPTNGTAVDIAIDCIEL